MKGHGPGDHLHVSTFDKGGWLAPFSKTLAINRTPHWEPVGPPGRGSGVTVNINGPVYGANARQLAENLAPELERIITRHNRRNGGLAFGAP